MAITKQQLINAGFTEKEIEMMRRAIKTHYLVGGVQANYESILQDLSKRWWTVFIVMGLLFFFFSISLAQNIFKEMLLTNVCISLFTFVVCCYVIPLKISTKARRYLKIHPHSL